jgi:carboxymethylenebutenolidase
VCFTVLLLQVYPERRTESTLLSAALTICHFAEDDSFIPTESVTEMEQALQAAGRLVTVYRYPGTKHWFFEENRPEYDVEAARLAWERTIAFLHQRLE